MGAASRRKGHAWEREVASLFARVLGDDGIQRGLSQTRAQLLGSGAGEKG